MINPENIVGKILKGNEYICGKCKKVFDEELRRVTLKNGKNIHACKPCLLVIAKYGK